MQSGDKDGYGRYGVIDGDDECILCHECGSYYKSLGSHITRAHGMTADEYRAEHGIPQKIALISPAMSRAQSAKAQARVGSEAWGRMVSKRDPLAASRARTKDAFTRRGEDKAVQIEAAKDNIRGVRKPLTRRCIICDKLIGSRHSGNRTGQTCSPLCERIARYEGRMKTSPTSARDIAARRKAGESLSAIGRAVGVSSVAVRVRIEKWGRYLDDCRKVGHEPRG